MGKSILVFITGILLFAYSIALFEKIKRPNFKNLRTEEFIIIGIVLMILILINLKWVFQLFNKQKR